MEFLYFLLIMGFLPLFAYQLYHKWEENPDLFEGEEGRRKAKNVFSFLCIAEFVIVVVETFFFRNEMFENERIVIFCLIVPFVSVYYITNKKQVIEFIGNIIKRRFNNEKK